MPTFRSALVVSVVATSAMLLAGCSGIRVVRASKAGGEIALLGGREEAMNMAHNEMGRTCGGPGTYDILEEGEVVVGQTSTSNSQTEASRGWAGRPRTNTSTRTDTYDRTEWRVKYACKGAAAAAPAPAAAPGAPPAPAPMPTMGPSAQIHELVIRF